MTRTTTYSPADHHARWRPKDRRGRKCGYTFRGKTCGRKGAHYCEPRADRVVMFFARMLVHTKGPLKRTAFEPVDWQEHEIIRPLFGEVLWSDEWGCYCRRYRIAYIIVARKNGKSELAAGIQLYMLVGDDEDAAEVYCAAKDTKQAGKVFEPALRMVQLSPKLSGRLKHIKNARRLVDEGTGSHYEILTSDALGELGHNPHAFNLDEVLSQPSPDMWEAMTTAAGARLQELCYATSTETNDSASFGASLITEAERVQADPTRAPHIFSFVRKLPHNEEELERLHRQFKGHRDLPVSIDPFDERNWKWANPGLDQFKSRESMRRQAMDAQSEPSKENSFRQFQANQRVQQLTRWIPMDLWDDNTGELALNPDWLLDRLEGEKCWAGLDLSSKLDLTAWCLLFEDGSVLWRFWCPESVVSILDEHTSGRFSEWARDGWVTVTDGDTIDYERIYADITTDWERYIIVDATYDKWCGEPVRQAIVAETGLDMYESNTTYERMTPPMKEFMRRLKAYELAHHGNPVARWMADNVEKKSPADDPDRQRPVKPDRDKTGVRIDGIPALLFALDGAMRGEPEESVYETRGLAAL